MNALAEANAVRTAAKSHLTPERTALARELWSKVWQEIQDREGAKRPKPLVYEVHHMNETARLSLLTAIGEGKTLEEAGEIARRSVKLID